MQNTAITKKAKAVQKALDKYFSDVTTALTYKTPFQLLVATMLSAQCTDVLVNKVTPGLFKKYSTVKSFAEADLQTLEKDIYPITFYRNKAASIKKTASILQKKYQVKIPKTLEELIELPGVARKTANVVLGHAYGIASGVVVDTHVLRTALRLGLTTETDPKKVELDLMKIIPKKDWIKFSDQLIWFGRTICTARNNKCCEHPVFKKLCTCP